MAGLCALSHYYKLWGDIESIRDFDVCFSVDTGWNTVEEHIPVLYYIKSHYKNAKILTILLEDNTMEMIREHSDYVRISYYIIAFLTMRRRAKSYKG